MLIRNDKKESKNCLGVRRKGDLIVTMRKPPDPPDTFAENALLHADIAGEMIYVKPRSFY